MYELTWELVCLAASLFRWEQGAAAAELSLQVPGWAWGQLGAQPPNKGFVPPGKSAGHSWPVCMWLIQLQKASSLCVQLSKSTRPRQASASLYRGVCVCVHTCAQTLFAGVPGAEPDLEQISVPAKVSHEGMDAFPRAS